MKCEQDLLVRRAASPRLWLPTRRHRGRELQWLGWRFTLRHGSLIHPTEFHPQSPAFIHRKVIDKGGLGFPWGFSSCAASLCLLFVPRRSGFWRRINLLHSTLRRRIPSHLLGAHTPLSAFCGLQFNGRSSVQSTLAPSHRGT